MISIVLWHGHLVMARAFNARLDTGMSTCPCHQSVIRFWGVTSVCRGRHRPVLRPVVAAARRLPQVAGPVLPAPRPVAPPALPADEGPAALPARWCLPIPPA